VVVYGEGCKGGGEVWGRDVSNGAVKGLRKWKGRGIGMEGEGNWDGG